MATRYEYYTTGDTDAWLVFGVRLEAQTFTPSIAHKITSVKLKLYRIGLPGTLTVSIRATNGSGHPTGADLCSGTTNGNTLPHGVPAEWREITLGAGYNLSAGIKYAIVATAPSGNLSNCAYWRGDYTNPTYWKGCRENKYGAEDWISYTDIDLMFEEWGEAIVTETAYDTMVGLPTSWLWEKCDYDGAEKCPVGAETGWIWKEPTSGGPDKTPQGSPISFSWGSE